MDQPPNQFNQDQTTERVEHAVKTLQKEYVVIGKTHIKPWQAWL